jgi:serine/threonine-protein kinase RIM15
MSTTKFSSNTDTPSISGREPPRFVGTPDYLAPESILGIGADDRVVDWWALGVVLYEFLYGIPPFHAETPEKVFDNVISRRINWHEDEIEISAEAHDLMDRLMCSNPQERLGSRGADEVKKHAFFAGIDWATIATAEASFVPEVTDPESTDYFDSRGAAHAFHDDDGVPQVLKPGTASAQVSPPGPRDMSAVVNDISSQEDFGTFNFKNLPVLKQANDDVIRKLRVDSMAPIGQTLESAPNIRERTRSASGKVRDRTKRKPSDIPSPNGPPSPSTSTSSAASTPSRASIPPSTPGTGTVPPMPIMPQHFRRPSELNALDRVKSSEDSDLSRRASAPTRIRAGSSSSMSDRSTSMEMWHKRRQISLHADTVATGGAATLGLIPPLDSLTGTQSLGSATHDRALDVLIAEDNPISQKVCQVVSSTDAL